MDLRQVGKTIGWQAFVAGFPSSVGASQLVLTDFHQVWTEQGHSIREQVGDDGLLADFLWKVLPPYSEGSITLYRGENLARWESGRIGFCWTQKIETARMFGRGLNAVHSGGVLLQCDIQASAIIAGPSAHSEYLDELELTVDPRLLGLVEVIERYP